MENQQFLGTTDVAEAAGVTREWVRRKVAEGEIEGFKVGRDWLIPREEAKRWLAQRGVKVTDNG